MITFKCKMCGGDLTFEPGASVAECPYCGTNQTLPKLDDDKRANLYDRANHFRRQNEFDKAMAIYEQVLAEDRTDAEAYWSLVLCRYGIEYVEDPASHKRVPTVNRVQYASILADEDYKSAVRYASEEQKYIYQSEAETIAEIQKGILDISKRENPFDIFICYKETDESGRRTKDSVLAQEIYYHLTNEGYKVFFSRITLEDKLGQQYEPFIFAALNSAKVMLVIGTKPDFFNAVWVKNEWSRFIALTNKEKDRLIIPCYRDMDPYDLPDELSLFQSQDMSKIGFIQDLIRGIKKVLPQVSTLSQENSAQEKIDGEGKSELSTLDKLEKLQRLYKQGVIDESVFNAQRQVLINSLRIEAKQEIGNNASKYSNSLTWQDTSSNNKSKIESNTNNTSNKVTQTVENKAKQAENTISATEKNQSISTISKVAALSWSVVAVLLTIIGLVMGKYGDHSMDSSRANLVISIGCIVMIVSAIRLGKKDKDIMESIGAIIGSIVMIIVSRIYPMIDNSWSMVQSRSSLILVAGLISLVISIICFNRNAKTKGFKN